MERNGKIFVDCAFGAIGRRCNALNADGVITKVNFDSHGVIWYGIKFNDDFECSCEESLIKCVYLGV